MGIHAARTSTRALQAVYLPKETHSMLKKRGSPTGRTPASEPNMQTLAPRTEEGARIREAFVGKLFETADGVQQTLELALSAVRYDGNGSPSIDRAVWELVLAHAQALGINASQPPVDPQLAGSRFDVRGGLRPSEVILLRRAIGYYCRAYQDMMRDAKQQWEKEESRQYIKAADVLDDRLLRDLVQHKE